MKASLVVEGNFTNGEERVADSLAHSGVALPRMIKAVTQLGTGLPGTRSTSLPVSCPILAQDSPER